jgi:hypothetical protein
MKKLIVGVMLFGLCACGGGGGGEPVSGGQGPAEPGPAATTTADDSAAGDANAVDSDDAPPPSGAAASLAAAVGKGSGSNVSKQLCAFLQTEVSEGRNGVGRIAADFAGWIGEDPGRAAQLGSKLDATTSSTCPKVRTQLLKLTDRDSLGALLGR